MQNIPWVRSRTWILIIFTSQLQPQTAWIRSHALAILEQTHSFSPARFQNNLFDLQNRVHFLVIGSKYRQLILGVRYDLAKAVGLDVCLRTFFCLDKFVNHFPVWQEAMQCEVWMLASHEWLAGYTDYRELRYTVRIRSSISVHSATKTMYNYNISENHTAWLMYFVLRTPCIYVRKGSDSMRIEWSTSLQNWEQAGTDPACMYYYLPALLYAFRS